MLKFLFIFQDPLSDTRKLSTSCDSLTETAQVKIDFFNAIYMDLFLHLNIWVGFWPRVELCYLLLKGFPNNLTWEFITYSNTEILK